MEGERKNLRLGLAHSSSYCTLHRAKFVPFITEIKKKLSGKWTFPHKLYFFIENLWTWMIKRYLFSVLLDFISQSSKTLFLELDE